MEIAKEQIFSKLKMDPVLQTQGKDISTRPWHASLAFSPLRAVACICLLFHKYKLSFLSLCLPNPHFTLAVIWAYWTLESHMRTNKKPRTEVCVSVRVCVGVGRCVRSVLHVDISYKELSLIVVAYDQVKGVYSYRVFKLGCWPLYTSPKISECHDSKLKNSYML